MLLFLPGIMAPHLERIAGVRSKTLFACSGSEARSACDAAPLPGFSAPSAAACSDEAMQRSATPVDNNDHSARYGVSGVLRAVYSACVEGRTTSTPPAAWHPAPCADWRDATTDARLCGDKNHDTLAVARRVGVLAHAPALLWPDWELESPAALLRLTRSDVVLYSSVLRSMARGHAGVNGLPLRQLDALLRVPPFPLPTPDLTPSMLTLFNLSVEIGMAFHRRMRLACCLCAHVCVAARMPIEVHAARLRPATI